MVNIHLSIQGQGQGHVHALSIPTTDIERLSINHLKWLRYITFTVCGSRGDLSLTPGGPAVDYETISGDPIAEAYYYTPQGDYHFIDYQALNDQITSSQQTARRSDFRRDVMARDGGQCVFTRTDGSECDAAHIISRSKGDEYISVVIQDRRHLYHPIPDLEISINSIENGIFLSPGLHRAFSHGKIAFLNTPNFALDPGDIPRVEQDAMPPSRLTLQHLEPDLSYDPVRDRDARMGTSLPSIILDFMYGVAVYRRWKAGLEISLLMEARFVDHYESIPRPPPEPRDDDDDGQSSETDDPRDGDYEPGKSFGRKRTITRAHRDMSDEMLDAMDAVLLLSRLVRGPTPKAMAAERQKQEEQEQLHEQEASRVKVKQWRTTVT